MVDLSFHGRCMNERSWEVSGAWHEAVRSVIRRWLGPIRRAVSGTFEQTADRCEGASANAIFSPVEPYSLTFPCAVMTEEIVGDLYSSSYRSPALLGDKRAPFEADLRRNPHALSPDGRFTEAVERGVLLVWREEVSDALTAKIP